MRPNKMRELLKSNKPTLSTHIHTTWPSVVEAIAHTGLYDYVEFVGEYGPFDLHDLDNLARAADIYNMSMQLNVDQEPRGFLAQRAIGSAFHSILFADCRSAADVQECVRIVRAETPEDGGTYGVATRRFRQGAKRAGQLDQRVVGALHREFVGRGDKRQVTEPGDLGGRRFGKTRRRVDARSNGGTAQRQAVHPLQRCVDPFQIVRQHPGVAGPFLAQCQWGGVLHVGPRAGSSPALRGRAVISRGCPSSVRS
jgi:hypothetical protein